MAVTPTGPLSLPMECLRVMLANSTSFRTWTGTVTVEAAKARIHLVDLPRPDDRTYSTDELQTLRPLARIDYFEDERGFGGRAWGSRRIAERAYQSDGRLVLDFSDDVPAEDAESAREAKLRFLNNVGLVIADLWDLAGATTYLTAAEIAAGVGGLGIHDLELFQQGRCDEATAQTQGDHYRAQFVVQFGI